MVTGSHLLSRSDADQMAPVAVMLEMFEQPILFYPWAARIAGNAMAGLFLSYAIKHTQRILDDGGPSSAAWFSAPVDEVLQETGMTRFEQQAAKRSLVACGLLETQQQGLPARKTYRVNLPRLMHQLEQSALKGRV